MTAPLLKTDFHDLKLANRGKVRDIYDLGDHLLIVATDRISAFDVIMNEGIPFKGHVLTQISRFWFDRMADIIPHHVLAWDTEDFPAATQPYREQLRGRSMLVKKAQPLPVECIARGYISGSGWKEYRQEGSISGVVLPPGLVESQQLPEPIFTPSTKAELGAHDENISFEQAMKIVDRGLMEEARDATLAIYRRARDFADTRGIIIADTKFEFGLYEGRMIWIDEALTPDSSRFWPKDVYRPGGPQPSFDKQFLRDYLETLDWPKQPPPPTLPDEIVRQTSEKYLEALERLTGMTI